jgi:hypothetical protein
MRLMMTKQAAGPLCVMLAFALQVRSAESAGRPVGRILEQSADAYTIIERAQLAKELTVIGIEAIPELGAALGSGHWHIRHCALLALGELAKEESNRAAFAAWVPVLGKLVVGDAHHGVRQEAAKTLGLLAERGKGAQNELAKAAVSDEEAWVRAAAATSLAAVKAEIPVMIPVYDSMIRSADKASRASGIREANRLFENKVDIAPLIPALKDVFSKPVYDANFSGQTRVPAMELLIRTKTDTRDLVPFIMKDLASTGLVQADGYHPYQRMTLKLLGRMGASAEAAIPMLEQVIADPSKFGCDQRHPDYKGFISDSKESIEKIRSDLKNQESRQ